MAIDEIFDDKLLGAYADHFYGYGAYSGKYWFLGMEEGGGGAFSEVQSKLTTWNQHGRQELEDLYSFHHDVGIRQWFRPEAKMQPTWSKFIQALLLLRVNANENRSQGGDVLIAMIRMREIRS